MSNFIIPQTIKVLKNNSRYYSSFLEGRQHIYAFTNDVPLNKCKKFIEKYKERYRMYPPADNRQYKKVTRIDEGVIYTQEENTEYLQRYCLMYNVGLSTIEKFNYEFNQNFFTVDISARDILPEIDQKLRVELLTCALILSE